MTFSPTVISGKSLLLSGQRTSPLLTLSWTGSDVTSSRMYVILPVIGRTSPAIVSRSVVFPAPFGPMIETTSSSLTSIETP